VGPLRELEHAQDFADELIGPADDVSIVHRETSDPEQPVECPDPLVPIDRAEL
jgi:hypothetical protein